MPTTGKRYNNISAEMFREQQPFESRAPDFLWRVVLLVNEIESFENKLCSSMYFKFRCVNIYLELNIVNFTKASQTTKQTFFIAILHYYFWFGIKVLENTIEANLNSMVFLFAILVRLPSCSFSCHKIVKSRNIHKLSKFQLNRTPRSGSNSTLITEKLLIYQQINW